MIACVTSAQITAFIPPYNFFQGEKLLQLEAYTRLQYSYKLYKQIKMLETAQQNLNDQN